LAADSGGGPPQAASREKERDVMKKSKANAIQKDSQAPKNASPSTKNTPPTKGKMNVKDQMTKGHDMKKGKGRGKKG
jgi:hypothetical protein